MQAGDKTSCRDCRPRRRTAVHLAVHAAPELLKQLDAVALAQRESGRILARILARRPAACTAPLRQLRPRFTDSGLCALQTSSEPF